MPKKPKSQPDNPEQSKRFIEIGSKGTGTAKGRKAFDAAIKNIARLKKLQTRKKP